MLVLEQIPRGIGIAYWFAVGAVVGSFLNVVIARLPAEESIVRPRSRCPRCKTTIAWYDNIPLLSYLLLRGHCRTCREPISARYPLVELLMAALAVAVWIRFGVSWELLLWLPLSAALLAIVFLDIDHWWVPDVITLPAIVAVAGFSLVPGGIAPLEALLGLIPAGVIWAIGWLFRLVTGREGMGLGDVKLLALIGLAVGPIEGISVLLLASVQGSLVGLIVVLTGGHQGKDDNETPLGEVPDRAAAKAGETDAGADRIVANDMNNGEDGEEEWVPHPRAFPFGPFLVLAALEVVLLPHVFGDLPRRLSPLFAAWLA